MAPRLRDLDENAPSRRDPSKLPVVSMAYISGTIFEKNCKNDSSVQCNSTTAGPTALCPGQFCGVVECPSKLSAGSIAYGPVFPRKSDLFDFDEQVENATFKMESEDELAFSDP